MLRISGFEVSEEQGSLALDEEGVGVEEHCDDANQGLCKVVILRL